MLSINCYMFHHSEGDQYLDWRVGLVFVCLNRLFEGDMLDLKHVAVDTYHELYEAWANMNYNLFVVKKSSAFH